MNLSKKLLSLLSGVALLASAASPAHSTTFTYSAFTDPVAVSYSGQGFGANSVYLTVQKNAATESGCIAPDGVGGLISGSSACGGEFTDNNSGGTTVTGGDEKNPIGFPKQGAPTLGSLGITNANQIGILFDSGSLGTLSIDDLSLKLYDSSGTLLDVDSAFFASIPAASGTGTDGYLFTLDGAGLAAFSSLSSGDYLALDAQISPGNASSESFRIVNTDPPSVTPEPSSLLLFGTGIIGAAGMLRRRIVTA